MPGFRRWKPNAAQKAEYRQRMLDIEAAKSNKDTKLDAYTYNCTGDCVKGDEIAFFNPGKASERLYGKITKESYGADKQQHTFTIELEDGNRMLIKGRNLYKNGVYRKPWIDEEQRKIVADDKHSRGDLARAEREIRKANNTFENHSFIRKFTID